MKDRMKTQKWNKLFLYTITLFFLTTLHNCSSVKSSIQHNKTGQYTGSGLSVLAGPSAGGVIDNTLMSGLDDLPETDAITGATSTRFNAGVHPQFNIGGFVFETGLDYLDFKQSVTYNLPSNNVNGVRSIQFRQIRVPLTYNFRFFKKDPSRPKFVLKAGASVGYSFSSSFTGSGNPPGYEFENWDYGPTLGVALYPFKFTGV